jgi:proteasome lid subunit RPN8/RPN11
MSLKLSAAHAEQIRGHLARAYPEEGCGVLLGRDAGETREVKRVIPIDNRRADSRANRYLIAPEQLLEAERAARREGLEVIGFFHSHPDHPARPSAFDLEHAWPYYSYLIASVKRGTPGESRSFRLVADRSRFEPEALELAADATSARTSAGGEAR